LASLWKVSINPSILYKKRLTGSVHENAQSKITRSSLFIYIYIILKIPYLEPGWKGTASSVADPDPGSGIRCLFDHWIRDPGWEKVSIQIRDPG
jgi:hypothetical protein